uniref:Uncharacterized protein n=1 Tax=Sphaerodactylus townsendi TaxID=933632 RepID=A0ACB8FJY0_9SAUR
MPQQTLEELLLEFMKVIFPDSSYIWEYNCQVQKKGSVGLSSCNPSQVFIAVVIKGKVKLEYRNLEEESEKNSSI